MARAVETRPTSFATLSDEHLDGASALLATRHREHRRVEPGLDPAYETPNGARAEIVALLEREGAFGVVAESAGEVSGFLIGTRRDDDTWGPNVWVEAAGHAVGTPELIRDLYAVAAERWVADGRTSHYAVVPATDPVLVDAWFRLGFGHQHVHGLREPLAERPFVPDGLLVRPAARDDVPALARVDLALPEHQALSPVFSPLPVPTYEERLAEWTDDFDEPQFATFVAECAGVVVGSAVGCPIEESSAHTGLARPPGAGFLGFAAVLPEQRGTGAGRALGEAVLAWAAEAGHSTVVTDWRMTNLLSSRTWPRLGFRPTFYRMFRAIA